MKHIIIFIAINSLLFINVNSEKNRKSIDSINSIPFEVRLEKAASLDKVYLINASNAKKIKYVKGEAESYSNLSLIYYFQGKYEKDLMYS